MNASPSPNDWPVNPARIERNWRAISMGLDAPRPTRLERFLRFFGLPAHITRLVVATPALRRAWFLATGLAILIGLGAADATKPRDDLFILLMLAPLVPVLGVSLAYGSQADPTHEASLATPMRGLRLVLTRAATVLGFSTVMLSLAALLTPGDEITLMAFAWLLPSLGLTSVTIAAMSVVTPRRAASITATVWAVGVSLANAGSADPLIAFTEVGQILMILLTLVAGVVIVVRRDRFDLLGVAS